MSHFQIAVDIATDIAIRFTDHPDEWTMAIRRSQLYFHDVPVIGGGGSVLLYGRLLIAVNHILGL